MTLFFCMQFSVGYDTFFSMQFSVGYDFVFEHNSPLVGCCFLDVE